MTPGDRDQHDEQVRQRCISLGVEETRRLLHEGKFGDRKGRVARAWLAQQDADAEAGERRADLELAREANALAAQANRIAEDANTYAKQARTRATWANIIAAIAAVTAIVAVLVDLLN